MAAELNPQGLWLTNKDEAEDNILDQWLPSMPRLLWDGGRQRTRAGGLDPPDPSKIDQPGNRRVPGKAKGALNLVLAEVFVRAATRSGAQGAFGPAGTGIVRMLLVRKRPLGARHLA